MFIQCCPTIISKIYTFIAILIFTLMYGCQGEQYSFQVFTFPMDKPAHEDGWRYKGVVKVTTNSTGSMFRASNKKVTLNIFNSNEKEIYSEVFSFSSVSGIKAEVNWEKLDTLKITLIEHGNSDVDDERSRFLAKNGAIFLEEIVYRFNAHEEKFIRI